MTIAEKKPKLRTFDTMPEGSIPQAPESLREHLEEQLEFLRRSGDAYDEGFKAEAKRLAVTLRLLLHDTGRSHSLLGQLGLKDRNFLSTAVPHRAENKLTHGGLIVMAMGQADTEYVAPLDDCTTHRWLLFGEWWGETVFEDDQNNLLSREDLILTVANKDGGAHVDPELTEVYARLSRDNSMAWVQKTPSGEERPIPHPERAAVRQVAHEVLRTLLPQYLKERKVEAQAIFSGPMLVKGPKAPEIPDPEEYGRNDPCPCGSGHKYKVCHGRPY